MSDSITGLDSSPILWYKPIRTRDLTSSYINVSKFFEFTGTTTETKRIIDGIGQVVECTFEFTNKDELNSFLTFFEDRKSSLYKFWISVWINQFELYEPISESTGFIRIKPCYFSQSYQGYERIWLLLKDGSRIVRHVTSATDYGNYEELQVDSNFDRTIEIEDVVLFGRFILCRFGSDELEFDYDYNTEITTTTVKFYELVTEYEDYDAVSHRFAELYELKFPTTTYRYTSYYKDIEYNYHLYEAVPMKRSRIEHNLNLFADKELEVVSRPTKALREYVANMTLLKVILTLTRLDLETGQTKVIFKGMGKGVSLKDDYISILFSPISSVFSYSIPKFLYQPLCNNILFDRNCGLGKDAWKIVTTVMVQDDGSLYSNDFSSKPDGWFIGGFVRYQNEYRLITNHQGSYIWIQAPFSDDIDNKEVEVFPGCDGSPATCRDKFNNLDNFNGFPYIPNKNPVIWGV